MREIKLSFIVAPQMISIHLDCPDPANFQIWTPSSTPNAIWLDTQDTKHLVPLPSPPSAAPRVFLKLSINGLVRSYTLVDFPSLTEDSVAICVRMWTHARPMHLLEHASFTWAHLAAALQPAEFSIAATTKNIGLPALPRKRPSTTTSIQIPASVPTLPRTRIMATIEATLCFRYPIVDETWWKRKLATALRLVCCSQSIHSINRNQLLRLVSFIAAFPPPSITQKSAAPFVPIDEIAFAPPDFSTLSCLAFHILQSLLSASFADKNVCALQHRITNELGDPQLHIVPHPIGARLFFNLNRGSPYQLPFFDSPSQKINGKTVPLPSILKRAPKDSATGSAWDRIIDADTCEPHPAPEHAPPPFLLPLPAAPNPDADAIYALPPAIFFWEKKLDFESLAARVNELGLHATLEEDGSMIAIGVKKQSRRFWFLSD